MGYLTNSKRRSPEMYPNPRGGAGESSPFARNFAIGPELQTDVVATGSGTPVPWEIITSGAPGGVNVPITPISTGIVRIFGVISLKNTSNDPASDGRVQILISVNGTFGFPSLELNSVGSGGVSNSEAVPFLIETTVIQTPIGVLANIQISVLADADGKIVLIAESSTVSVQEVSAATG